jgi:3-hydroxyisobutyrate dehydrogenase-like beta-hydroxyacid dehydrogenase
VRLGIEPARLVDALSAGSGATFAIPSRGARILKNDFSASFRLELGHKDLRLARELAEDVHLAAPMTSGALLTYALARSLGLDAEDTIALVKVWERALGVAVRDAEAAGLAQPARPSRA